MRFVLPPAPSQVKVLPMQGHPQTILITGGSGFVGQALVRQLRQDGHSVRTLARSGADFNLDLALKPDLQAALQGCNSVVHLASRVHVMNETEVNPLAAYRLINLDATEHLAKQALAAGVHKFVFLSSIKVNGEKTVERPFSENMPEAPEDPYGVSKFQAEVALDDIARAHPEFKLVILRPPLVYGPGVKANFAQLIGLVRKAPLLPFGAFTKRRSLIYVGNLVSAIVTALKQNQSGTFVVSDGKAVGVGELCAKIAEALNRNITLLPIPVALLKIPAALAGRTAQISRLTDALEVDSSGFEKAFGWKPPFTLEQGLRATVAAQKDNQ